MSKTEAQASAGEDLSPAQELKAAVAGFMSDITTKLQQQDERMTRLDRKSMIAGARPALSQGGAIEAPHQKAFAAYLRSGDDDALRGLEFEGKAMSTSVAADGGYLVDPQTAAEIQSVLNATASIRAIANVVNVDATSYDVLIDHTEMGSGWATETAGTTETGTPTIDRISIPLHELSALPKVSQRLLDDTAFDIESWLAGRIADKFARSEAAAFVAGDGVDKPRGFLDYPQVDDVVWAWGNIGTVPTGTDGDFSSIAPGDAIIDLVYSLGAEYRAGASFVMNSKTAGAVRKLKDADGRFLWSDGLAAGEPARLMGYPVLIAEDMPDIATGSVAIAFGNFAAGYTVAQRPDLRVLRDPFSAKPHVLFYATKRVGGAVSDFAAIKLLKFAVS
ncbi:phage major capsid protein [Ponticoccus sp. SC2-23]|uniref:phage major capsid protein n=1 Tax=Alexandriicola marinus TaxID=2081710 RepID=UPI000FDB4CA9|nr:phage major capsid protein [Alexandriicola marinus]MBM1222571.1 phage major capsid protein [Ponticoccus sp. SC6-9]MBM1227076.1 phage major capsid protein [Ponticoccus sp. SC6-15]MBM1231497.1 phage major capsid protein [Ponticoccus sp. SC6-38]MBM1236067.1 phage major capsid protein [Ponticoccus sp. SC6-45]MBM1240520.1 phage major capsid protein [Ponticoccus sp. SC6-49]MBM1245055.1 phage major capsid protein [Ponticoccus sp. SC2-64]MBM1249541.1 phage major capsid protein [Ponticoccus sp. SC